MGPLTGTFQAQLHWNLHIRAEFKTCQLGGPYPGSMQKSTIFGLSVPPLVFYCIEQFLYNAKFADFGRFWPFQAISAP